MKIIKTVIGIFLLLITIVLLILCSIFMNIVNRPKQIVNLFLKIIGKDYRLKLESDSKMGDLYLTNFRWIF
jgi:hypothetical protein